MFKIIDGNEAHKRGFAKANWKLEHNAHHWVCSSPKFGSVEYAVVADKNDNPVYDRPIYREAPHVITVPWGRGGGGLGRILIGLILEERVHGGGKFWGVPRGFMNPGETPDQAARREAGEEAGASVVRSSILLGRLNPNPTFVGTDGPVVALEVDIERLGQIKPDRTEKIYKVQFFTLSEVYQHVLNGQFEGGSFNDGVSLAAIMKFISHYNLS